MEFADCVKFANENPVAWLATVDGDQPRVRGMGLWYADETGFYFQAATMKDLVRQLQENGKVEFAFYRPDEMVGTMLRVSGEVEFINDLEVKKRVLTDRPFLKEFGLTAEGPELVVFRISEGEAHFWDWESNVKPKEIIKF
ncbi:pyridoxamine 5'-phosphate oxidase family protein [Methanobacterium petrolearium]|uniref:pyridoxamine 5'-phosphate oxidase family protein n=1 Tax=Methanobacterium petrolearium TaxID=710190 RepID=UPI001AE49257|nr:pyridoxamine 5'-phosphate oxidase family protein [Methanobacterium petrolearium]MBP1946091.1 putative pyridoxamine 5'-phosphate oxidase family protein [Methanobacterium petrolearium]BDZ70771.1 pyridoxamine 5'-phosphate oxidase [Methanobacterium petrolearium]